MNETMGLRAIVETDHEWLVDLHNDPVVLHNMTHSQPITMAHHLAWWKKISHDHRQIRLIFEVNGVRAGLTKFYDIDRANQNCVLGADLHREFRGMGFAHHMWELMLDRCFNNIALHRVSLTTAEYNLAALHVYKKLGFKGEGRLVESLFRNGKFYDQIMMHMLRSDWTSRTTDG